MQVNKMNLTYQKASASILTTLLLLAVTGCSLLGSDNPELGTIQFEVEIPRGILANLDQWLTGPNEWDFPNYGMIMGNQAAQSVIQANGASVFTLGHANVR